MNIKHFLKLVEIQTKVASVIPYLVGILYAKFRFNAFNLHHAVLMFLSLICIDMATTGINNYIDYKQAIKREGYGFEVHNSIVNYNLSERAVIFVIVTLLLLGVVFGIQLALATDLVVLVLGILSFAVGILYSYGPIPISRTPFGEIFSGSFMGMLIPFITLYTQLEKGTLIHYTLDINHLFIRLNWIEILYILILSMPLFAGIANIMLANNLCDREDDFINKRYTLIVYLGQRIGLKIFEILYYIAFICFFALCIIGILPKWNIVYLLLLIPIKKGIIIFKQNQLKSETFVIAIKNFILIGISMIILLFINIIIQAYL